MASTDGIEEVASLTGHTSAAWGVAFHPTSPLLASCSGDKSIRLYSFTRALKGSTFQQICTLPSAHSRTIRQIAFSPDGKRMASASFDSTVGIWERTRSGGGGGASVDAGHAALSDEDDDEDDGDGDEEEWENVGSLEGHESEVKAVAWSYDGALLATCGRDKSVWIWDASAPDEDFECLAVLMDHTQDVKHVTFSPNEEILASSSYDDTVKLYASDYTSDEWMVSHSLPPPPPKNYNFPGQEDREPEVDESGTGHKSTVWASSFSPCGNYLASCSDDLTIRIWARFKRKDVKGEPGGAFRVGRTEKEGWYCATVLKGYHDRTIFSLDWTETGNWTPSTSSDSADKSVVALGRIASVGGDGKIRVFGISAQQDDSTRNGHTVHHALLGTVEQAHGVHDVNHVQWCRLGKTGKPAATMTESNSATPTNRWRPPPRESPDLDEDGVAHGREQASASRTEEMWKESRNVFATAGDDGIVKVWRLLPSHHGPELPLQSSEADHTSSKNDMQVDEISKS